MVDPNIQQRVATLEESARQGDEAHQQINQTLEELIAQVAKLEVYLANNGGFTLSVRDKRVKFAGSVPLPWSLTLAGGSGGGVGWLVGRMFGVW